ncbi:MAG: FAD-dependent oxidoreductase, partial [Pseudomonadota bacterium]
MSERVPKHVIVIGAGIVGVSCAIWLQRAGHRVTLMDRQGPASGTSQGNAGILAAGAIVPIPAPGLATKGPAMLLDKNAPLFLRWRYLPKLLPFLTPYLGRARERHVQETATALADLLLDAAEQHRALARGTAAERYIEDSEYLFGYRDKAAFDADAYGWAIKKKAGVRVVKMDAAQFADHDPAMAGRFGYGLRCLDHGHITDPGAYVKALVAHFVAEGGDLEIARVEDIETHRGKAVAVITVNRRVEADSIVLATGMWSRPLAEKLGVRVNMEAERGYHIEYINPSIMPRAPIMVAAGKFVLTPMEGRLRCAGIVEFGGMEAGPSKPPFDLLRRQTEELLPDLTYDHVVEWTGFRPSTVDSIPLIGPFAKTKNVFAAFGHQHIGLTGGPKTGRWIAGMVDGTTSNA